MIIWIQIQIQDITRPRTRILGTILPNTDQEGTKHSGVLCQGVITKYSSLGVVSIILFWTYVEIGVGFLVACLPLCAGVVDRILLTPIAQRLRSFSSRSHISERDTKSQQEARKWKGDQQYQEGQSLNSMTNLRDSVTQHQEVDIEMIAREG